MTPSHRLLLIVALSMLCTGLRSQVTTPVSSAEGHPYIQKMVDAVSADSLMKVIRGLQTFPSRYEFDRGREDAAAWLVSQLRRSGAEVQSDYYKTGLRSFEDVTFAGQSFMLAVGSQGAIIRGDRRTGVWEYVGTDTAGPNFHGVDFVTDLLGWVVGDEGAILHTEDAGLNWVRQGKFLAPTFTHVCFVDNQQGIVVGAHGTILVTSDGGQNWVSTPSGTSSTLLRVYALDKARAWSVGADGTILSSSNGGRSWTTQQSGTVSTLTSVYFVNDRVGWVVGWASSVLKTTNGGATWKSVPIPPALSRGEDFQDVCFTDSLNGWIVRPDSYLLQSTDGGNTWKEVHALNSYNAPRLAKIAIAGKRNILACSLNGELTSSTDGGSSWFRETPVLPNAVMHKSRNIRVTIPGAVTPEKECILVAHYDALMNTPGADDNASGVAAICEAMRVMKSYQFESTLTFLLSSAGEVTHSGSGEYASQISEQGKTIIGVLNANMIGYPVSKDTTHLGLGVYLNRNRLVDSLATYTSRYGVGAALVPYIDSVGISDHQPFALAGYASVNISEGTLDEIWQNNPYTGTSMDNADIIHSDLVRRATKLLVAAAAELAVPSVAPSATWQWESPFQQWSHLRSSCALDALTLFAAGDLGTIVKTTDGGRTWVRQVSETNVNLHAISFANASIGFAAGDNGLILRTTNGGQTWTSLVVNPNVKFLGLTLTDAKSGTAVGYPSAIYRTTNGGTTWVPQLSGPAATLQSVFFTDAKTGIIVGSSGTILRTTNGGSKWNRMLTGFEETDTLLNAVSFLDSSRGIAVGRSGTILRTTNGGVSWNLQPSGTVYHLYAVAFADSMTVFASGDAGIILRSTDGGRSWETSSYGVTDFFSDVSFASRTTGTAVGSFGTVFRTTDGGTSWTLQTQGPRVSLQGVWYTSPTTGTVAGYRGAIFHTIDGGKTWTTQASGTKEDLWGVTFTDDNTGFIVGQAGMILKTTNAGTAWTPLSFGDKVWFSGISFGSQRTGIAVGKYDGPTTRDNDSVYSVIYRTTNGGTTWLSVYTEMRQWLTGVSFGTGEVATAVSVDGFVLRTTDGGTSWNQPKITVAPVHLNAVSSVGPNIITAVGDRGTILRSNDGGASWVTQASGTPERLNSVSFSDESHGVVVGDSGVVLRTSNRGATWMNQPSGVTSPLYAIHLVNLNAGTAVGDRGTIIHAIAPDILLDVERLTQTGGQVKEFSLAQNFPNPFNPSTSISYELRSESSVTLKVYDLLGREVATLANGVEKTGLHTVRWSGRNEQGVSVSSGIYFYQLHAGSFVSTKKMILLK